MSSVDTSYNSSYSCLDSPEIECMIEQIKALIGGGIVDVEIPEKTWCLLLKSAIQDYVSYQENWLIKNQWGSLANKGLNVTDICYALTTRPLDYAKQFADAYSAEVGLQSHGNFELKKDYILLKPNKQVYEIPSGREVNEVLWTNQPIIPLAVSNSNSDYNNNYNLNYGQNGVGSLYGQGVSQYHIVPAYDTVLRAADYRLKQKFLGYEPYYKVTASTDGKKYIHLINGTTGGSITQTSCGSCNSCSSCKSISSCKVYYHYYDTSSLSEEEAKKCLEECKNIIKYPFQVPLENTDFCDLNSQSKSWIRKYLTALAKESLGNIRGKFSGAIPIPNSELTMDYSHFFSEAQSEKESLITELSEFLNELTTTAQLTKQAEEAEALASIVKYMPTGIWTM